MVPHRHVSPQLDYLIDLRGKQIVDFVGRYESLQTDRSCQTELVFETGTTHRRRADDRALREHYDEETEPSSPNTLLPTLTPLDMSFSFPRRNPQRPSATSTQSEVGRHPLNPVSTEYQARRAASSEPTTLKSRATPAARFNVDPITWLTSGSMS